MFSLVLNTDNVDVNIKGIDGDTVLQSLFK